MADSAASKDLRRTPLFERHKAAGARLIDFGGWEMPVQYTGILEEHNTVREAAGIFDVCHMGEIIFEGRGATKAVQRLITNDLGKLQDGGALYTCVCYPSGGIVDDCIVYRHEADRYMVVVNAANVAKDLQWFRDQVGTACTLTDQSRDWGLLAVQGPKAVPLISGLTNAPLDEMQPFTWTFCDIAGIRVAAARTGYTGEDGFELFVETGKTVALWDAIIAAGTPEGLKPIGLGARDTLRLEARLSLYGNDIDAEHSPIEAGLGWVCKGKGYIGEEAINEQKQNGVEQQLVGFVIEGRGIARHGYDIFALGNEEQKIGTVTSGTTGPTVGKAIGLGYVPPTHAAEGTELVIDCRGKPAIAKVVKGPFDKRKKPEPPPPIEMTAEVDDGGWDK
jgi:aminomethyltransferase